MKFGLVAVVASSLVAGVQSQEGYCGWAPNRLCWQTGYPECCATDNGAECPLEQPDCDIEGGSYCTWSPNYGCYSSGWPACCDDPSTCTQVRAGCDATTETPGASYCTFSPDYNCYTGGWPACCVDNDTADVLCGTDTKPPCDITSVPGSSYCTDAPNFGCFTGGVPECCLDDATTCPEEEQECDVVGQRWCLRAPEFNCYVNGFPICCTSASAVCPEAKPACEIADDHVGVMLTLSEDDPAFNTTGGPEEPAASPATDANSATTTAPDSATSEPAPSPPPDSTPAPSGAAISTGSKGLLSVLSMVVVWVMV